MSNGKHCEVNDPRKILGSAREEVKNKVKEKIKMFAV
jgi:fructose/tagatose bisphosphate aldolase